MQSNIELLVKAIRKAVGTRVWAAAVQLARKGAVAGISASPDEVKLAVKARGHARPFEVWLWPDDGDWGCDCGQADPCVHVCAAALAVQQDGAGDRLPQPKREYQVKVAYRLTSEGTALRVERGLVWPDGRSDALERPLAQMDVIASSADVQAESLLAMQPPGALPAEGLRRLVYLLAPHANVTVDGRPVRLSIEPVVFEVRVSDEDECFKVGLYRPEGIDQLFRGAALVGDTLHPTSHGDLKREQRKLLLRGVRFRPDEVGRLVGDYLPRLRERIPVTVLTERLPDADGLTPRVQVVTHERTGGLEVQAQVVYGDPPVARVRGGVLEAMGGVVPARDLGAERLASRRFEERVGLPVGVRRLLPPERAAAFLTEALPRHDGPVLGDPDPARFRVTEAPVMPHVQVQGQDGGWGLDVRFEGSEGKAEVRDVLAAWSAGKSLVPLLEGGFAPLPVDWLKQHGGLLRELMEARDSRGRVERHATAALVELLEDTDSDVPPDLGRLRAFLEGEGDLPEGNLPPHLAARLRPYQEVGTRWLRFLREVDLGGVLADDMGLGKTIQALGAMAESDGPHLVIAPTSVLRNWQREVRRFVPELSVNVYHGPDRRLDRSDVTLTSYALLRMDLELLRERRWSYVVLDEAQAIKNPNSQTARSARLLQGRNRLALTGTPVENRLEELWSIFRFLMPGFLGSLDAFRQRFVRPIEAGDGHARAALRRRVKPYVLRRLKSQVAQELPPLTQMVVRCEMGEAQRRVYETVRLAARDDVQRAIADRGASGSTMMVLEALLRMRQACCDPALLPGDLAADAGACKLDRLDEMLVELVCEDHKMLVFSQWTSLLDRVEERLQDLGIPWVRLDGATRDRQAVIDRFQAKDGPPVFLLSLKAGGTGLNLTAADYVVHLDPWWNPAVEQQATDRAHRIGQDRPVVSCRFIAQGTVEERILDLQEAKRDLAEAAVGSEGGFLRALSADELRALFEAA